MPIFHGQKEKDKPTFLLIKTRFTISDASGLFTRLVRDPFCPNDDYAPKSTPPGLLEAVSSYEVEAKDVKLFLDANTSRSGKLIAIGASGKTERHQVYNAEKVITYRSKQHIDIFERLIADESRKREILKLMSETVDGKLYMIVGYKTFIGASVAQGMGTRRTLSGVSRIRTLPVTTEGVSAGAKQTSDTSFTQTQREGEEEEIVFAIEYKVVKDKKDRWKRARSGLQVGRRWTSKNPWQSMSFNDDDDEGDEEDEEDEGPAKQHGDEDLEILDYPLEKDVGPLLF